MAEELINMTEIVESLNQALMSSISPLVTIFKIVGIALLIYIIFLILKALFQWKTMAKISNLSKNVEDINSKMDILIEKIDKIGKKEEKTDKPEKEKRGIFKRIFGKSKSKKIEEDKKEKK